MATLSSKPERVTTRQESKLLRQELEYEHARYSREVCRCYLLPYPINALYATQEKTHSYSNQMQLNKRIVSL